MHTSSVFQNVNIKNHLICTPLQKQKRNSRRRSGIKVMCTCPTYGKYEWNLPLSLSPRSRQDKPVLIFCLAQKKIERKNIFSFLCEYDLQTILEEDKPNSTCFVPKLDFNIHD